MKLHIALTSHKAEISLQEGKVKEITREFLVDNDLSQKLLIEIDALLSEAGVTPTGVEGVEYEAHDAGFTTTRIGQVVADTYNFVLKHS